MTGSLFIIIVTACCIVSTLLTEAIKKFLENKQNKDTSANIIAAINAIIVGCGGTAVSYILLNIPFTLQNIIILVLMGGVVWLGSMITYDKVIQSIKQILSLFNK